MEQKRRYEKLFGNTGPFLQRFFFVNQSMVLLSILWSYMGSSTWSIRNDTKMYFLRVPKRGILSIYGTLFFDPPFLWSQMVKNYFFTIENPFTVFFWAQQYPKRPFENHWSSFSGKGQKWKNGPKSHFLVIDCLETWSACSLQLFCVLKAVKPRKRVW